MFNDDRSYALAYKSYNRSKTIKKRIWKWIKVLFIAILILLLLTVVIVFVVFPIIFMYSVELQRLLMFTNVNLPTDQSFYESFEEPGLKNFYITVNKAQGKMISVGAWHFLPESILNSTIIDADFDYLESLAKSKYSILLYFHGSGETREDLLKKCYKLRLNFHVIIFDYRDFADSTPAILSEESVVDDSMALYYWLQSKTNASIYVWGHSLGTPLSSNTIAHLRKNEVIPFGLILESPLTSMREEIPIHPYGKIFAWLPWFEATILNPLERNGFNFETIKYILNVECPIMILHAEDDSIIPFNLGERLYIFAITQRNASYGPVNFHAFSAELEHDHFFIYEDKKLNAYIRNFTKICEDYGRKKS